MFIVDTSVTLSLGAVKSLFAFSGLEKSLLVGMNFVDSGSLGGNLALGLNSINVGAVAGASASSTGGLDTAMYAALGVFLACALYLLLDKKVLKV